MEQTWRNNHWGLTVCPNYLWSMGKQYIGAACWGYHGIPQRPWGTTCQWPTGPLLEGIPKRRMSGLVKFWVLKTSGFCGKTSCFFHILCFCWFLSFKIYIYRYINTTWCRDYLLSQWKLMNFGHLLCRPKMDFWHFVLDSTNSTVPPVWRDDLWGLSWSGCWSWRTDPRQILKSLVFPTFFNWQESHHHVMWKRYSVI